MKIKILLLTLLLIIAGAACSGTVPAPEPDRAIDYLGAKADAMFVYEGEGNDYSAWTLFYDYIDADRNVYQRRDIVEGITPLGEIMTYANGELDVVYMDDSASYFSDMTRVAPNTSVRVLKEPLGLGAKWDRGEYQEGLMMHAEITALDALVTVPYGNFNALELTVTYDGNGDILKEYYVKGLGMIKSSTVPGDERTPYSSSLAEIRENTPLNKQVLVFRPGADGSPEYDSQYMDFHTNQDMTATLSAVLAAQLGDGGAVNGLTFARGAGIVRIDISRPLPASSAEAERAALRAMADTIGYMYNAGTVYVTINGDNYTSPHVTLNAGEYLSVDLPETLNSGGD